MPLPKTTPPTDEVTSASVAPTKDDTAPVKDDTVQVKDDTTPAKDDTPPVDYRQVISDLITSMREVQESVRADRERIEELQLANGLVIRQGAPDNEPTTNPPDDSYIDPAQFDPSNMDFKI
jgi:hypothetical protein